VAGRSLVRCELPLVRTVAKYRRAPTDIQNGGVDRMSEMSSILCIPLYRDVPSHNEPE